MIYWSSKSISVTDSPRLVESNRGRSWRLPLTSTNTHKGECTRTHTETHTEEKTERQWDRKIEEEDRDRETQSGWERDKGRETETEMEEEAYAVQKVMVCLKLYAVNKDE